jgi:hypothetical protein
MHIEPMGGSRGTHIEPMPRYMEDMVDVDSDYGSDDFGDSNGNSNYNIASQEDEVDSGDVSALQDLQDSDDDVDSDSDGDVPRDNVNIDVDAFQSKLLLWWVLSIIAARRALCGTSLATCVQSRMLHPRTKRYA